MVKQAAIAHRVFARLEFLVAPFVFKRQVIVAIVVFGADVTEGFQLTFVGNTQNMEFTFRCKSKDHVVVLGVLPFVFVVPFVDSFKVVIRVKFIGVALELGWILTVIGSKVSLVSNGMNPVTPVLSFFLTMGSTDAIFTLSKVEVFKASLL